MSVRCISGHGSQASTCVNNGRVSGYTIRILRMHALKKDVFLMHPGNVRVVPTQLDRFDDLLDVMRAIVTAKVRIHLTCLSVHLTCTPTRVLMEYKNMVARSMQIVT